MASTAIHPPAGVRPDLDRSHSMPSFVIVTAVFCSTLCTVCVIVRVFTRLRIHKTFAFDDCWSVLHPHIDGADYHRSIRGSLGTSHRSFSSPGWDLQTSLEVLTCSQLGYVIYPILSGWAMLDGAGNHAWNFTPEQIVNLAHVSMNAVLKAELSLQRACPED